MEKINNHKSYFIEEEELYEEYNTIRGIRYAYICPADGMQDQVNLPYDQAKEIKENYLNGK